MSEGSEDVAGMFSGTAQIYANLGVALAMVLAGVFATINKWKSGAGKLQASPVVDALAEQHKLMTEYLERLIFVSENTAAHLEKIRQLIEERETRDALEREYQRGRESHADRPSTSSAARKQHP